MAAGVTIQIKRKASPFVDGELAAGELGMSTNSGQIYASDDGSTTHEYAAKHWLAPVIDTQVDATLDPGGAPTTGDRYILEDVGNLNANFGAPAGVGDDDIVEFDGSVFIVVYDASVEGAGYVTCDLDTDLLVKFNGAAWTTAAGVTDHGALTGLADDDHTQYSLISSQAGAPATTPSRVGEINIDVTADEPYISTDTASSSDWTRLVLFDSLLDNSAMVIDGGTI